MFPFPIDMRPVYPWMSLTHPIYGPANLAWYSTFMTYSCYLAWVDALMKPIRDGEKNRAPT